MIANERQYRITKEWIERFEHDLAAIDGLASHVEPAMDQLIRDGVKSQLEDLREQAREYEAIRDGRARMAELSSLAALPEALIHARIVVGLSEKQLAERLGLEEQQIRHYEATRYADATFSRFQAVAAALGVTIRQRVLLPTGPNDVAAREHPEAPSRPIRDERDSVGASEMLPRGPANLSG